MNRFNFLFFLLAAPSAFGYDANGVELGGKGIRCFGVQPGFIATERMAQDMAKFGFDSSAGAPAVVPAKVVRWLCTDPAAEAYNGQNIEAQDFCFDNGLLPGWPGPSAYNPPNPIITAKT